MNGAGVCVLGYTNYINYTFYELNILYQSFVAIVTKIVIFTIF